MSAATVTFRMSLARVRLAAKPSSPRSGKSRSPPFNLPPWMNYQTARGRLDEVSAIFGGEGVLRRSPE